jgi:hypothetical protein
MYFVAPKPPLCHPLGQLCGGSENRQERKKRWHSQDQSPNYYETVIHTLSDFYIADANTLCIHHQLT